MSLLNPGDPFPKLTISATDGQSITLPDAFAGDFGVVLFYRGSGWKATTVDAISRAFDAQLATPIFLTAKDLLGRVV